MAKGPADEQSSSDALLSIRGLEVVYDDLALVLRGVSLEVAQGEIVALLGANGAGKTTLLRAITGLLDIHNGKPTKGSVRLDGDPIERLDPPAIVRRGIAQVMEGRRIFAELSVDENLKTGAFTRKGRSEIADSYAHVLDLFPVLKERRSSIAGYLSGGEQQMVAMGRALMAAPKLLLLDEPSLGLAPKIVQQIRDIIVQVNGEGTSVLLVEQNASMALEIAGRGYVMETGRIVKEGAASALLADEDIKEFYLGTGGGDAERVNFKNVKSYRRKKRWAA